MKIKVASAVQSWQSPDGKVTIYDVTDEDGKKHQTMSKAIGEGIGKEFDCIEYTNKKGNKFIKQEPKEDGKGGKGSWVKIDEREKFPSICVSYAIRRQEAHQNEQWDWKQVQEDAGKVMALMNKLYAEQKGILDAEKKD